MDILGLIWLPDYLIWFIAIVVAAYIYGTWPYTILSSLGYKGPKPLPFVGNIGMLFNRKEHFAACDGRLKAQYGKMVAIYEGRTPSLVIYDPEIIKHVLVKDFSHFCNRRKMYMRGKLGKSLLDLTGSEWKRVRTLMNPFFSTRKLKHHMLLLDSCLQNMIGKLDKFVDANGQSADSFDAKAIFGEYTMESICLTAFGIKVDTDDESSERVISAARLMMKPNMRQIALLLGMMFPFLNPLFEWVGFVIFSTEAMDVLTELVDAAIEERKNNDKDYPDFIQALIRAHDVELTRDDDVSAASRGKGLSDEEVMAHAVTFLLAGYDTTSTAISYLMFDLSNNPLWQERVVNQINDVIGDQELTYDNLKELTILDMCLDESLRITPALFRYDRRTAYDVTIKGHVIPKGCLLAIPVMALHHDPDLWHDPETYDPERFLPEKKKEILNSYIYHPFGIGPRSCMGKRFAIAEVKMAAVKLLLRYKWSVSTKTKVPLQLTAGFFPVPEGGLWLNIQRRADN